MMIRLRIRWFLILSAVKIAELVRRIVLRSLPKAGLLPFNETGPEIPGAITMYDYGDIGDGIYRTEFKYYNGDQIYRRYVDSAKLPGIDELEFFEIRRLDGVAGLNKLHEDVTGINYMKQ